MRHALGCVILTLTLATQAQASFTYDLVSYAADQDGATLSGFFTFRGDSGIVGADDLLDWSVTISMPGVGSFTTGQSDPSSNFVGFNGVTLSPTEMTIVGGEGSALIIESSNVDLTYIRSPDQYSGGAGNGGNLIVWMTNSPSMGGIDPWVVARTLGVAVPEPSSFPLLGTAVLGLGIYRAWRR